MPQRQYAFEPQPEDPRRHAERHWDDLRNELNITRDALEATAANERALAALVDMLRKEVADTKAAHAIDQVALTVMRTKLKAAGMLVLDALKADQEEAKEQKDRPEPEESPRAKRRLQDLPPATAHRHITPPLPPLPGEIESEPEDDESAVEIVQSIHRLANKWP